MQPPQNTHEQHNINFDSMDMDGWDFYEIVKDAS